MAQGTAGAASERIVIVGCGFAGGRFLHVLERLRRIEPWLAEIVAVVDRSDAKLRGLGVRCPKFADVRSALAATRPTVAIVAVNEHEHYAVLRALDRSPVRGVLSEKPLTTSLEQAENLADLFADRRLSLNMVERFSPVVDAYLRWRLGHPGFVPVRVEFQWGKHRIGDPRPTMGVFSDMVHPIDLIDYLFGIDGWRIDGCFGISSDFSVHRGSVVDTVSVLIRTRNFPVSGQASFAWPRRHRRIAALLSDGAALVRATFQFDDPRWDCDQLSIDAVDRDTGRLTSLMHVRTTNADFAPGLDQVFKVDRFTRAALDSLRTGRPVPALVDYAQAVRIQRILEDVAAAVRQPKNLNAIELFRRSAPAPAGVA